MSILISYYIPNMLTHPICKPPPPIRDSFQKLIQGYYYPPVNLDWCTQNMKLDLINT